MYVFINSHGYSRNTQSIVSKRYLLKISITLKKKGISNSLLPVGPEYFRR